jgi:hypothetical protein
MTVIIGSWSFQWGNRAWLCLLHRPIASLQGANHSNLGPKFYGPFLVMERIGSVAYKLQLSRGAKFHDVFHFELLKKYHGPTPEGPGILPPIRHGRACLEPAEVIRCRMACGREEVLVRWSGQSAADASWVPPDEFRMTYPSFQLADELILPEGRDVI